MAWLSKTRRRRYIPHEQGRTECGVAAFDWHVVVVNGAKLRYVEYLDYQQFWTLPEMTLSIDIVRRFQVLMDIL